MSVDTLTRLGDADTTARSNQVGLEDRSVTTVVFEIHGMTCDGCENSVVRAVTQLHDVQSARADHAGRRLEVGFAGEPDDEAVRGAVEDAGFDFVGRRSG